jgi:hypothetical protein
MIEVGTESVTAIHVWMKFGTREIHTSGSDEIELDCVRMVAFGTVMMTVIVSLCLMVESKVYYCNYYYVRNKS